MESHTCDYPEICQQLPVTWLVVEKEEIKEELPVQDEIFLQDPNDLWYLQQPVIL